MSFYILNTNETVFQSLYWQFFFFAFGALFIFVDNDGENVRMFFICP